MSQIIDIKIVKGRRADALERESAVRKIAEELYSKWKKDSYHHTGSIEEWAHNTYNVDERYKKLYTKPQSAFNKEPADTPQPEKTEISIEQQILTLMKYGWEMKGHMMIDHQCSDNFFQTMVLYVGTTITEDLLSLTTDKPALIITENLLSVATTNTPADTVLDHAGPQG